MNAYLMATAVLGVGTPAVLMAVIATESWNTVCDSLVPKKRVPEVPAETGAAAAKYVAREFAEPLHVAVPTLVVPA